MSQERDMVKGMLGVGSLVSLVLRVIVPPLEVKEFWE